MNCHQCKAVKCIVKYFKTSSVSRVAQWKRAGPITQRSEDQNLALLAFIFQFYSYKYTLPIFGYQKLTSATKPCSHFKELRTGSNWKHHLSEY